MRVFWRREFHRSSSGWVAICCALFDPVTHNPRICRGGSRTSHGFSWRIRVKSGRMQRNFHNPNLNNLTPYLKILWPDLNDQWTATSFSRLCQARMAIQSTFFVGTATVSSVIIPKRHDAQSSGQWSSVTIFGYCAILGQWPWANVISGHARLRAFLPFTS